MIKLLIAIILLSSPGINLYAQTGISLEAEIYNIERTLTRQDIPAADRHDALVRLASLRQLSGDIEGAARNWLEAAAAIPGSVDDDALLACAYCLAAMGEWERAAIALEPLLSKSAGARFLNISIKAVQTGDLSELIMLSDNPAYSENRAQIIFLLWKLSNNASAADEWQQRLIGEFSQTPEGRIAAGVSAVITIRPSPFWLFIGGLDSFAFAENISLPNDNQIANTVSAAGTAIVTSVPASQTTASQPSALQSSSSLRLQTGIYSREANAQSQAASLRQAGFSPVIEHRIADNTEMWAVTVPAGADSARTASELRAAGFESFPVR